MALAVAFAVPVVVERRARAAARETDALTAINALAMAAGAADAFCTGLEEHGENEGFLDAFPQIAFTHAEEALVDAVASANRLGISVLPVVTARLRLQAFVARTLLVDQIRDAGNLAPYLEFMRSDADGLEGFHDQVRAILVPAKRPGLLVRAFDRIAKLTAKTAAKAEA